MRDAARLAREHEQRDAIAAGDLAAFTAAWRRDFADRFGYVRTDAEADAWIANQDPEWLEHQARHEFDRRTESMRERARERRALYEHTLPRRAFEAALTADERAPAIVAIRDWDDSDDGGSILLLTGGVGCGKTVAAAWWCWFVVASHTPPTWITAAAFARLSRYSDERAALVKATELVVDDLGSEYLDPKGSLAADVDELIDSFYSRPSSALVITSNCTASELRSRYGERFVDRIREAGTHSPVLGPSLRRRREA